VSAPLQVSRWMPSFRGVGLCQPEMGSRPIGERMLGARRSGSRVRAPVLRRVAAGTAQSWMVVAGGSASLARSGAASGSASGSPRKGFKGSESAASCHPSPIRLLVLHVGHRARFVFAPQCAMWGWRPGITCRCFTWRL